MVNVSLLAKWSQKLLGKEEELWNEVLVAKYGVILWGRRALRLVRNHGHPCCGGKIFENCSSPISHIKLSIPYKLTKIT